MSGLNQHPAKVSSPEMGAVGSNPTLTASLLRARPGHYYGRLSKEGF